MIRIPKVIIAHGSGTPSYRGKSFPDRFNDTHEQIQGCLWSHI